jgi:hypothetical protein
MLTSGPMTFHSDARIFIMTVAAEPTFLDTNILVYASVDSSSFDLAALTAITESRGAKRSVMD